MAHERAGVRVPAEALRRPEPSDSVYWQHGRSTERDFLYATTATLGPDQLRQLSGAVGPARTLLVLCSAFRADAGAFDNLTVKKIPRQALARCEWGREDCSLHVEAAAAAPAGPGVSRRRARTWTPSRRPNPEVTALEEHMNRTPVSSSNLRSVGYDPVSQTLEIGFLKSGVYQYFGVPQAICDGLLSADSHGSYFDQFVRRGGYTYRKV